MTTGERIREARKKAGLTQRALGELCKMPDSQIRQYELGMVNPKIEQIQRIAKALGTTPLILYEGADIQDRLERASENFEYLIKPGEIEHDLLDTFWKLNEKGGKVALERLKELTEISRYTKHSEN